MIEKNFIQTNNMRFVFRKIDAVTGIGLENAVFQLTDCNCNGFLMKSESDKNGFVEFYPLCPGNYLLTEVSPPENYFPINKKFFICIDNNGCIFVNKKKVRNFTIKNKPLPIPTKDFIVFKTNPEGIPLPGAVYQLIKDDIIVQTATTNIDGIANFVKVELGSYTLVEIQAPTGYLINTQVNIVVITYETININGILTDVLAVYNQPIITGEVVTGNWIPYANYVALVLNNTYSGNFSSQIMEAGVQYAYNDPSMISSLTASSGILGSPFITWVTGLQNGIWYYRAFIRTADNTYYYGDVKSATYP